MRDLSAGTSGEQPKYLVDDINDDPPRTSEDIEVWSVMLERIGRIVDQSNWHHACYVRNIGWLRRFDLRPPRLREINEWLLDTGWRVTYSDGYVQAASYRDMLAKKIFPISRLLRPLRSLEHSAAPDFFHDVLGHLPMLFDADYRTLIQQWGERARLTTPTETDREVAEKMDQLIALRSMEEPDVDDVNCARADLASAQAKAAGGCSRFFKFETFFTWAIEFGIVCAVAAKPTLIGAAALSSPGEMANILGGKAQRRAFVSGAVGHPVDYTVYQSCVFEARDFQDYISELHKI